jgi:uncharacterized membrane protein
MASTTIVVGFSSMFPILTRHVWKRYTGPQTSALYIAQVLGMWTKTYYFSICPTKRIMGDIQDLIMFAYIVNRTRTKSTLGVTEGLID